MTHFRKQLFCAIFLFFGYAWTANTAAWGQQPDLTGNLEEIGRGKILRDNVAKARDEAIANGLLSAVERGVGMLIPSASVVDHFQLLSDRVYSQANEFVHDYRVLTESKSGKHYRVVVQATLLMNALQTKLQDIGVLVRFKDKQMPSAVLLLSEQLLGEASPRYSWDKADSGRLPLVIEDTLSTYMREKGFVILQPVEPPLQDTATGPEYEAPELNDENALRIAELLGAEIVIVGKAVGRFSGNVLGTDMKSIEATLSVHAIRADNGTVIGSFDGTRAVVNADEIVAGTEAIGLAASDVAKDLTRQIVANWGKEASQPAMVELFVKGIKEYADFIKFRSTLRNEISGVRNIYLRAIKAGEAKMDVDIKGTPRTLADELMLQSFQGFGVNIFEVGEKEIKLELIPKRDVSDQLKTLSEGEDHY